VPIEQPAQPVDPSAPTRPLEVDLARVALGGMVAWGAGLVVTVVLALVGRTGWVPVAVCVTGLALGVAGRAWAGRHDSLGRRARPQRG